MTTIPNPELKAEIALANAPRTRGCPAVTPDFLTLLKLYRWDPQGLLMAEPRTPVDRCPIFLIPFVFKRSGPCIWWIGDSAQRCVCSPGDFALLLKGRALKSGLVMAGGQQRRLDMTRGWASLVPSEADPVKVRKEFITLTNNVLGFVVQMDALMPQPSTVEKGKTTAKLLNALDLANQGARMFGLGVKGSAVTKKMLKGGAR